jgi:hypothetical protein
MVAATLTFKLPTSNSPKIKVEVTRSPFMDISWKPITNSNNVVHLVENYAIYKTHWESLCGRRGSKKLTESLEKVEGERTCCGICSAMQRRKIQSKSLLEASFQVS